MSNPKVTVTVETVVDRTDELMRALRALTKNDVLVGVPAESAARDAGSSDGQSANNAVIGYVQEFGEPEKNIPARPFLAPGAASKQREYAEHLKKAAQDALNGDREAVEKQQHSVGLIAQAAVQHKIDDGPFTPLSPATIYHRKHRREEPRDGEKPLIDKGALRQAIKYVIRKRGEK